MIEPERAASAAPSRVLVVDDDAALREVLAHMVRRLGCDVHLVADGVGAVEALASDRFDHLLLDLNMPNMSGEEVLRWLQGHPQSTVGLQVVVLTGTVTGDTPARLQELGAHAVMAKPLRLSTLRGLLDPRPGTAGPSGPA